MPEKARVFVAEDDPDFLESIKMVTEAKGHSILLTATTLADASEIIKTLPQEGIQVALLDGNLKKGVRSGSDGHQMVAAIREIAPGVKIIGMSGEPMTGVDIYPSSMSLQLEI